MGRDRFDLNLETDLYDVEGPHSKAGDAARQGSSNGIADETRSMASWLSFTFLDCLVNGGHFNYGRVYDRRRKLVERVRSRICCRASIASSFGDRRHYNVDRGISLFLDNGGRFEALLLPTDLQSTAHGLDFLDSGFRKAPSLSRGKLDRARFWSRGILGRSEASIDSLENKSDGEIFSQVGP